MIIQSKNVWLNEKFSQAQVEVNEGKIVGILPYGSKKIDQDYGDNYILPGLIDIHTHGYKGINANYITEAEVKEWAEYMPSEGVTSYLVTTSTAPEANLITSITAIGNFMDHQKKGATVLGVHMEGPFLEMKFRGAQSAESIMKPAIAKIKMFMDVAKNRIKLVAIAPETDDDFAMTKYCIEQGIVVTVGHTGATLEMTRAVKNFGVKSFTHTFNAMSPLNHREPGVAGAAMRFDEMYAEVISDGVHVHNDVTHILGTLKGKDKLILVTDSVSIKGLTPGVYHFQDRDVTIDALGYGRLKDGRLAGSSNKMNLLVKNCIGPCELPLVTTINAATCNPAQLIGLGDKKGLLKVGYDADIIVTTHDFEVLQTYVLGKAHL